MKHFPLLVLSLIVLSVVNVRPMSAEAGSGDTGTGAYYRSVAHKAYEKLGDLAEIGKRAMVQQSLEDPDKFASGLPAKEKVLEAKDAENFKKYATLSEAYLWAGQTEKAEQTFSWCQTHRDNVLGKQDKYVSGVIGCNLGVGYFSRKNVKRAEELLRASVKSLTENDPKDTDFNYLITDYLLLTLISEQNNKMEEANTWASRFAMLAVSKQQSDAKSEQAKGEPELKLDTSPEKVAKYRELVRTAYAQQPNVLAKSKEVIKGIIPDAAAYEKTLPGQDQVLEARDIINFKNYGGLSEAYLYEDQVEKAEKLFKWCQKNNEKILGADDRFINGSVATDFGFYYFVTKTNLARAEELLRLSIKTLEQNPTKKEQDSLITSYMILSLICEKDKKEQEADSFATHFCAVSLTKYGTGSQR